MKGLYKLSIFFTVFMIALGWFLFPRTKELIYVFERTRNYIELERLYTKKIKEKHTDLLERKLLLVKVELRREGADEYAMGYLQKSFSGDFFGALLTKFNTKHIYASEGKVLEIGYKFTKNTKYLVLQRNLYSFLGWSKKLIKVLRQLYQDTQQTKVLNQLYGLEDYTYAIDQLFLRVDGLGLKDLTMLRNFLSWRSFIKRAYNMTKKYITVERLDEDNRELHLSRAIYYSDDLQVIKIYGMKYRDHHKIEDLMDKAYYQEYYGFVQESLLTYEFIYKINPNTDVLDRIVTNSRYTNNLYLYKKYRFEFALLSEDFELFKEDIDDLLEEGDFKTAIKRCDLFINLKLMMAGKNPSADSIYYLDLSYQMLYLSLHEAGMVDELIRLIKSKKKELLTSTELSYLCDESTLNENNLDYFILYYIRSNYLFVQDQVMEFSLKKDKTFRSYDLFTQMRGKIEWTNLEEYLIYYKKYPN
ncbi:hypothetical protein MJH12_03705, partial [bacterium]|nr:hypothetical protein [bacterium]